MKHLPQAISQYLHDTGKILWFSKHQKLKNYVFLRPSWVTDILRQIVSAASGKFLNTFQEKNLKKVKLSQSNLEDMTNKLSFEGILSQEFLKLILSKVIPTDKVVYLDQILTLLSEEFEIGYILEKDSLKTTGSTQSEVNEKNLSFVIPWFQDLPRLKNLRSAGSNVGINVAFQFKKCIPVGIF